MTKGLSILSNVILVLQVFMVLLCFADLSALPEAVLFAGKLHPVMLHLPITLILLLLPFSLFAANRTNQENIASIFQLMLHVAALISTLTAIAGFFLAAGGAYDADSLVIHKWLGVSIAILSHALIYLNKVLHRKPMAWNTVLVLTIGIAVAGSHFGGTLTHGEGFFSFNKIRNIVSENEKTYSFSPASTSVIEKLNNPFRRILKVSANSPALVVKFSIKEKFDINLLKECKEIAEQIVELNLSGMPVDDQVFPILAGFENLEKLNLNATSIAGTGIDALTRLKKLQQLSVVNTAVGMQAILPLVKIASLKQVFIWNTSIGEKDIVLLKSKSAKIKWELGYQANKNEILQLSPPYLEDNDKLIFENDLDIVLKNPFPNAKIRYTTDGLPPDSINGKIYTNALHTKELLRIKAVTTLNGWITSEVIDFTVYPKGIACDSATLLSKPNRGRSFGAKILIDGKKGYSQTADQLYNSWLGFKKEDFKAGFHFGSSPNLQQVVVSTADMTNSSGASVFPPTKITIKGGKNPKNLKTIGSLSPEMPIMKRPNASIPYVIPIKPGKYPYIEIEMLALKSLPDWHQEKGQMGFVFLDEVFFY
jgi:uncharacterized membrane protein